MKEKIEQIKKLREEIAKEAEGAKVGLAPLGVALSALNAAADNLTWHTEAVAKEAKVEAKPAK